MFIYTFILVRPRTESPNKLFLKDLVLIGPALLIGLLWRALYTTPPLPEIVRIDSIKSVFEVFIQILSLIPERIRQAYGVLGWLDTSAPSYIYNFVYLVFLIFTLLVLRTIKWRERFFFLAMISILLLIPSLIEVGQWRYWPNFWQGRYSLPVFTALALVTFGKMNKKSSKFFFSLGLFNIFISALFVYINLLRYTYGIQDGYPIRFDSATGLPREWILLTGILMTLLAIQFFYVSFHNQSVLDKMTKGKYRK